MKRIFIMFIAIAAVNYMMAQSEILDSIVSRELNEVVVKGEKPHIKGEDGIMAVDLPNIVKDKPVSNILEALGYLPGVVNNNGMICLAGTSDVTIILNGELTNMPLQNLYQLLYTTPVDRLKTVEVMYTAPAKYHVNGAVINVVLKTPIPLDGLQGEVRAGYNQGHYGSYGGGLAATYAVKDWTFDLNYGLSRSKTWNHEETSSNHLFEGQRTMIEDDMRRISESLSKWQFGERRSCELDLQANDIFNRWSPTMTINHAGQDYLMKVRDMTRNFKFTFIWRFNGFKPKNDSSVDTSRFGTGK